MDKLKSKYEELQKILNPYFGLANSLGIHLSNEEMYLLCEKIFKQYSLYCSTYTVMELEGFDDFKVIAWTPYLIAEIVETDDEHKRVLLSVSITVLKAIVLSKGNTIQKPWITKISSLALSGFQLENFGHSISKNGLYTAFKTSANTSPSASKHLKEITTVHGMLEAILFLFS